METGLLLAGSGNGVAIPRYDMSPAMSIQNLVDMRNQMVEIVKSGVMREGLHYGTIPGTDKPCLYKPGAEMLCMLFGLSTIPEIVDKIEDWDGHEHGGEPLFFYHYRYAVMRGGLLITKADGSASTREGKHRWRWVDENDVPPHLNKERLVSRSSVRSEFAFAVEQKQTTGQYGKPIEYWNDFDNAIASGLARKIWKKSRRGDEMEAWEIASVAYRIPNDDVSSLVNTILKMAMKRALVAAILIATGASEFYTQDMEDFAPEPGAPSSVAAPAETLTELHAAIGAIFDTSSPVAKERIVTVMRAVTTDRFENKASWSIEETRAIRDVAIAMGRTSEPAATVAPSAPAIPPQVQPAQTAKAETKVEPKKETKPSATTPVEDELEDPFADEDAQRLISGRPLAKL